MGVRRRQTDRSAVVVLPLVVALVLLLAACATPLPTPSAPPTAGSPAASSSAAPTAGRGEIVPAPGSDSAVYAPNPEAIVVAVEAGHGGCLDWGVPDPEQRGPDYSEKAITLSIAERVRDLLEAEGITVVMVRDGDVALAGDDYPPLDCHGQPFRDVNGDGLAGFGDDDLPEATRTRDELQARLDIANLVRADLLVSIHVDSITDAAGTPVAIARSETFYTDETPWGEGETARLAEGIQTGVMGGLDDVAGYDREDRGVNARNLYMVAPPLFETTEERPDTRKQPTRGALMPAVLVEIGSITLPAEHELLLTNAGQAAAAGGIVDGVAGYLAERSLAARIELADADAVRGAVPDVQPGDGPPYWPPPAPDAAGLVALRLTNTGQEAWPDGLELLAGWGEPIGPYLRVAPAEPANLDVEVPPLAPGESVDLRVPLEAGADPGEVAWISLAIGAETFADRGSAPLQFMAPQG